MWIDIMKEKRRRPKSRGEKHWKLTELVSQAFEGGLSRSHSVCEAPVIRHIWAHSKLWHGEQKRIINRWIETHAGRACTETLTLEAEKPIEIWYWWINCGVEFPFLNCPKLPLFCFRVFFFVIRRRFLIITKNALSSIEESSLSLLISWNTLLSIFLIYDSRIIPSHYY